MNQCDGCRRGLPINERGLHRGDTPWDIMGCTAHLYEPLLMQDENSGRDGRRYNEWHASRPDARLNAREASAALASSRIAGQEKKENPDV